MRIRKIRSIWGLAMLASSAVWTATAQEMPEVGPPKEMKRLESMAGVWKSDDFQYRMDAQSDFATTHMRMEVAEVLEGAILAFHLKGNIMGMDFQGVNALSYHRERKVWQSTWIDTVSAYQAYSEGGFKDGVLVLEGNDIYQGQAYHSRDFTKRIGDDKIEWRAEMSYDGGKTWYTAMKAVYTRE